MKYKKASQIADGVFSLLTSILLAATPICINDLTIILMTFSLVLMAQFLYYLLLREIIVSHFTHPEGIYVEKRIIDSARDILEEMIENSSVINDRIKSTDRISQYIVFEKWCQTAKLMKKYYNTWTKQGIIVFQSNTQLSDKIYKYELDIICKEMIEVYEHSIKKSIPHDIIQLENDINQKIEFIKKIMPDS